MIFSNRQDHCYTASNYSAIVTILNMRHFVCKYMSLPELIQFSFNTLIF